MGGSSNVVAQSWKLCRAVVEVFSEQYLRSPNANDLVRLLQIGESRGFPVYVDDIVFGSTAKKLKDEFVEFMHSEFEMSMIGELTYFLGLQIKQCPDGIFLNQTKYAKNMVEKFGMKSSKTVRTRLGQQDKLSKDAEGKDVDQKLYRSIIGSLLYLTASRPDITFSVGVCARFQSALKESHLKAAKRILRYINGMSELGL
ncbi:uncharacterized mitochondrial protein AtMg00810-like [Andrographis paniculata]|uniref:uncharacterized mitochondrial protein AtMg00810-like n=1 Tax=Andrographis paniculata TaxID=175694 RepID=UPI0021E6EE1B|nr:uncharacterized mitochondrial protein AtMg00810-like [Andrographis paniculata]